MKILLGNTARALRDSLGLTQRAAAEALGVSYVHLCNIEKNRAAPSQTLIDKYRDLWGIDLYVLAWCLHGDIERMPPQLRKAAKELAKGWQQQIDKLTTQHRTSKDD